MDADRRETLRPTRKGTSSKEVEVSSESCQPLKRFTEKAVVSPFLEALKSIGSPQWLSVAFCRGGVEPCSSAFNIPLLLLEFDTVQSTGVSL